LHEFGGTLDSRVYPARQLPWRAPLFGENSEPEDQHLLRKHALPAAQIAAKNILYQHQYPRRRHFPEVLMSQLLAQAFATHHDLVPQGIGALPEPGCEAPPNQFGGVRTLQKALQILTVSDCLFSSFKLVMSLIKPVSPQQIQTTIDQLDVAGYFERRKTPMVEAETDLAHAYSFPRRIVTLACIRRAMPFRIFLGREHSARSEDLLSRFLFAFAIRKRAPDDPHRWRPSV
jgi:hypothetical protein